MADKKGISETAALRLAEQIVARSMPSGWSAKVVQAPGRSAGSRSVSLRIRTPDGDASEFGIVTKRSLNPMEAGQLLDVLGVEATTSLRGPKAVDVAIVAPDVDDIETAVRQLDLREVDSGTNVLIAEPFDPVVYERTTKRDALTLAAPTQIVADLLTGSGRTPSEGEELIAWMKDNDRVWRS